MSDKPVYGITETSAVLTAAGDLAVIIVKAKKQATGTDGKLNASALGQAIATQIMLDPSTLNDLETAAAGIGTLPSELKDLSLSEIFQLVAAAGTVATKCAAQVAAA